MTTEKKLDIATGNARLLRLADFLDALPPERFNYNTWVGPNWKGAQDLSCGTTACALGWAATMPEFRELGLRLSILPRSGARPWVVLDGADLDSHDEYPWELIAAASAAVFGLNPRETTHLFQPAERDPDDEFECELADESDFGPKDVAQKIRDFVTAREGV